MNILNSHKKMIDGLSKKNLLINKDNFDELDNLGFTILRADKKYWEKNNINFDLLEKKFDFLCENEGENGGWENGKKKNKLWEPSAQRISNLPDKDQIFIKISMLPDILIGANYVIKHAFKFSSMQIRNPIPYGDKQDLHIDFRPRLFNYYNYNQCSSFVYLDNANVNNGSLHLYPGTHKLLGEPSEKYISSKNLKPIAINIEKFNIVLLNIYTWHYAGKNLNGKPRRTIFINYRERSEIQQLNQKNFLSNSTLKKMSEVEKYLYAVRDEDPTQSEIAYIYRNNFFVKKYLKIRDLFYHKYLQSKKY